ncbi:MAG: tyrosine-type recombinase/integrase [Acidimicrobiales bacterium]
MVTGLMWDAGVKLSAWDGTASHSLRHSCAQHVLDAGGTVYDVQHTLGHSDSRTTETYLRREPPGLRDAIDGRSYAA